jgi:hypothetical protein
MSQEKEPYEDRVLHLLEKIAEQTKLQPQQQPPQPQQPQKEESSKGHKTLEEQLDCPDCGPRILQLAESRLKPKILKEIADHASGKHDGHCKTCGLKNDRKKGESCPLCGGTELE